jgi:hypothetical protein
MTLLSTEFCDLFEYRLEVIIEVDAGVLVDAQKQEKQSLLLETIITNWAMAIDQLFCLICAWSFILIREEKVERCSSSQAVFEEQISLCRRVTFILMQR